MRESIFKSTLRALFSAFAIVFGVILAIVVVVMGIGSLSDTVNLPKTSEMTVSADAEGGRTLLSSSVPVILRIDIDGVIGIDDLTESKFVDMLYDSQEGVLKDRVKGIILNVNTPGGLATDSSAIYSLFKAYKEKHKVPIFAYVDGMCASGGMYIVCAADRVYSMGESIIGSVGVRLGPVFNVSQTMDKVGIQSLTLTEGKNKDALNPFRPWKEGEDEALKKVMAASYEQFVNIVTAARPKISRESLINDYGAAIYIAEEAEKLGYIDVANSSYISCLSDLVHSAGIENGTQYQVIKLAPHFSVVEQLTKSQTGLMKGKIEHVFPIGPGMTSEMSGKLLYLYQP